ncbi:hypothetical protein MTO96_007690 [Rhipicephalus appendiculatus]
MSKISSTSSTTRERSKVDPVGKLSAQQPSSSSSTTPVNKRKPEDGVPPPSKATEAPTERKTKRVHSGHKPKSKTNATTNARASKLANTLNEAVEGGLTIPQRKDSPLPAPTMPRNPGAVPGYMPARELANRRDSRLYEGIRRVTRQPLLLMTLAIQKTSCVGRHLTHLERLSPNPPNAKEVHVEPKKKPALKRRTGDSTSIGETFVTHPDEAEPKSGVPSTVIMWSYCPLNLSFPTEVNSRDQRILCVVVVLVCAVMFVLIVGAVMLLFYAKRARSPLACVTSECHAARDYLTRLLNTSRDVCKDFYGYVCGSWLERRNYGGGSFRRDSLAAWLARVNESLLRDVGWEGHSGTESAGVRVMRHVYGNCHHYVSSKSASLPFEETLESARKQLNWNQMRGAQSYQELVAHLVEAALLSGCQTIMTVEVFSDHEQLVVRLSRGFSLLRKLTTTGQRHDLEKALERVLKNDLEKIVDVDLAADADLQGNRSAEWREEPEVTKSLREILEGMLPDVSVADWVLIFDDVLHSSGKRVYSTHSAFTTRAQSFRKAFRNIADNNGIAVTASYVASHLDAEVLSLEMSRERVSRDVTKTARFCLALAQRSLAHSWPKLIAKLVNAKESLRVLEAMNQNIRNMSHDFDVLFTWLPKTARSVMGKKIDLMTLVVVSGSDARDHLDPNDDHEDEDYAPLLTYIETESVGFVDMYLRTMAYSHERQAHSPPTLRQMYVTRFEDHHELAYSPTLHSVVVPTVYQMSPYLYATGVPSQFNYATVGTLMSARFVEMAAPAVIPARTTAPAFQVMEPQHGTAMRMFNASALCLQRLHTLLGLQREVAGSVEEQRHAMYIQAASLRLAYEALLASFGQVALTPDFRALWPEAQKTFFIRFCLLSCDADQKPKPLSPRADCLLPLHTAPEFAEVFECTSRDDFIFNNCPL